MTLLHFARPTFSTFDRHFAGLKVVIDIVMNHSSDEHKWFKKVTDPSDPENDKYKNYYVFLDGRVEGDQILPPNNWVRPRDAVLQAPRRSLKRVLLFHSKANGAAPCGRGTRRLGSCSCTS